MVPSQPSFLYFASNVKGFQKKKNWTALSLIFCPVLVPAHDGIACVCLKFI